jgi:hypothetical protein
MNYIYYTNSSNIRILTIQNPYFYHGTFFNQGL